VSEAKILIRDLARFINESQDSVEKRLIRGLSKKGLIGLTKDRDREGLDYETFRFQKTANYGESLTDDITVFKSEKSDKIVGYGFERASRTAFEFDGLNANIKLACLLRIVRAKEGFTQEQAAEKIGHLTMRHYQRLESGEENTTLETVEAIAKALPKWDFSVVLKGKKKSA